MTEEGADQCAKHREQEFGGYVRGAPAGKPGVFSASLSYYSDRRQQAPSKLKWTLPPDEWPCKEVGIKGKMASSKMAQREQGNTPFLEVME